MTTLKALPAAASAWVVVGIRALRGIRSLPSRNLLPILIGAGVTMQLGGNLMFQLGLGLGGLSLTVALTFAAIIVSSALFARVLLGEPIARRTVWSMCLLVPAVAVLRFGADAASAAMLETVPVWAVPAVIAAGLTAGMSYGIGGVAIRRAQTQRLTVAATIAVISTTGVLVVGSLSMVLMGPAGIRSLPAEAMRTALLGGVGNAIAFFSICGALRYLSVVRANLINSLQVALAAVAGVVFFHEPATVWLILGCTMTIIGLGILGLRDESPTDSGSAEQST